MWQTTGLSAKDQCCVENFTLYHLAFGQQMQLLLLQWPQTNPTDKHKVFHQLLFNIVEVLILDRYGTTQMQEQRR